MSIHSFLDLMRGAGIYWPDAATWQLGNGYTLAWGYGATAARLTPDQKVGSSNLSALTFTISSAASCLARGFLGLLGFPFFRREGGGGRFRRRLAKPMGSPRVGSIPAPPYTLKPPKPQTLLNSLL